MKLSSQKTDPMSYCNRYCFLVVMFSLLATLTLSAEKPDKPNILFMISDDLNTSLSGFGHPQCKTPELDKLADRGVKFLNMHCQYPVCGASRASLMSGLYPYTNKTMGNQGTLRGSMPDVVTMSQLFRKNGYYAGRVSKIYHMRIPMEIIAGTADFDDPHSWDEVVNVKAPEQHALGKRTEWSPKDKGSQTFTGIEAQGGDDVHADGKAAAHAIRFLKKNKDKPFFLAVGFVRPHVPLVAPKKYFDIYDRNKMKAPEVPENDLDDVPKVIRKYKRNSTHYGVTPELHKGLLQAYYASISYMDAQVGRILRTLEEEGLSKNTIVVFSSDHGYLLGHHHKFQKQHLFEESTRVPFIISVPWMKTQHGQSTSKITELIDLYPTLADLAQLTAPSSLQGSSLLPLLRNPNSSEWKKDLAFTVSRNGGESIKTEKWRYTQWGFGKSGMELYDLTRDPGEFNNLAGDAQYASILQKLKKRLETKRLEAGYLSFKNHIKKKQRKKKLNSKQ